MNLAAAVAEFETGYEVSEERGFERRPGVLREMGRAPSGDRYVIVTSGGLRLEDEVQPAWFATEELAAEAWLRAAWLYADTRPGRPRLFWCERPIYFRGEWVAVDQAGLLNDPIARQSIVLQIGTVQARFVLTK